MMIDVFVSCGNALVIVRRDQFLRNLAPNHERLPLYIPKAICAHLGKRIE